jgi:hypothetical protein
MQGSLAAAAARTANSDGPLPFFVSALFPPAHTHPTSPHSSAHLRLAGLAPVRYCPVLQVYSSRLCVPHHPSPTRSPTHPRPRPPVHRRLPASCPACLAAAAAAAAVGLVAAASARRPQTLPVLSPLAHARGCAWVPRHHTQMLRSASAAQLGPACLSSPSLSRALLLLSSLPSPRFPLLCLSPSAAITTAPSTPAPFPPLPLRISAVACDTHSLPPP